MVFSFFTFYSDPTNECLFEDSRHKKISIYSGFLINQGGVNYSSNPLGSGFT